MGDPPITTANAVTVSAIVPNYNYGRYLDERLRSLLNQSFKDLEVIFVDDASTDDSRDVVRRYEDDARLRTWWFDRRSASAYQRWNDGAGKASGKYLYFAGADDTCEPTLVERLVDALEAHPSAGLAYSRSQVIDADGNPQSIIPSHARWERDFVSSAEEELPFLLDQRTIPTASAVMVRRDVFERCGGFDTSFELAADHMLWARVLRESGFAYVAEPLNRFRTHAHTVRATTNGAVRMAERYRVYGFVLGEFDVAADARERTLDRLARNWLDCWNDDRGTSRVMRHRAVLRVARPVDPHVVGRMMRMAVERSTGIRVRGPRAVARYAWRRLQDERYLLQGRRILWSYTAHHRAARREFRRAHSGASPSMRLSDVGVMAIRPDGQAGAIVLPPTHHDSVRRVAASARQALGDATQCRFVPALTSPPVTRDTSAIDDVVQQRVITIQLRDPLTIDGLRDLSDPLIEQIERQIYGTFVIVDKIYVYRSPISRQQPRASWLWHYDNHPREVLKLMVYLNDVDEGAAPFEFLRRRTDGRPLYGAPLAPLHHHSRVATDAVDRLLAAEAEAHRVTGPQGTTLLFDDNVIHRGTLAQSSHRDVVVFQLRPSSGRRDPRIDPRWTGSFLHRDINRDPADLTPHRHPDRS